MGNPAKLGQFARLGSDPTRHRPRGDIAEDIAKKGKSNMSGQTPAMPAGGTHIHANAAQEPKVHSEDPASRHHQARIPSVARTIIRPREKAGSHRNDSLTTTPGPSYPWHRSSAGDSSHCTNDADIMQTRAGKDGLDGS